MVMKNFSVIILLLSFSLVSCHKESFSDSLISGKLKIVDNITGDVRINETVTLNFISDSGERYSSSRNTDDSGYIYFKGNADGKYIASFSYYPGTANDCFMEFSFAGSSREQEFIMNVSPSVTGMDTDVVITGYMADVSGSDNGYEYMQFMALKDIDFSAEPHCVIACRNNAVNAAGWVQGSYVTYKFNLVSGTVSQGEFFYVGGINKNINDALYIINNYEKMVEGLDYDINVLNELLAFDDISKQPSRKICATLTSRKIKEILEKSM